MMIRVRNRLSILGLASALGLGAGTGCDFSSIMGGGGVVGKTLEDKSGQQEPTGFPDRSGNSSFEVDTGQQWTFADSGDYLYDPTKIEVDDGVARLLPVDQTDSDNDLLGGWGLATHNATEWNAGDSSIQLTAGGMAAGSGTLTSRVMDVGASVPWTSLAFVTQRPTHKEIPNPTLMTSAETAYSEGNLSLNGLVLLLHLNEGGGSTSFEDTSLSALTGSCAGNCPTRTASGRFNGAFNFDGADDGITVPHAGAINLTGTGMTLSAWVTAPAPGAGDGLIVKSDDFGDGYGMYYDGANLCVFVTDESLHRACAAFGASASFRHVAATYDGTNLKLYVSGTEVASTAVAVNITASASDLRIGGNPDHSSPGYWQGVIDEVAIYSRGLGATEVSDLYKRGALRLRFQIRSCDDSSCTGEDFVGPFGSTTAYYSEASSSGSFALPNLNTTGVVSNNRYFQYRAYFETDDATLTPELKSVSIGPVHYPADRPYIVTTVPLVYVTLDAFAATMGEFNAGSLRVQLTPDGDDFYYLHSGSGEWRVAEDDDTDFSSVSSVNTNFPSYATTVGYGALIWKIFLVSDGTQAVVIDEIVATGTTTSILSP